LLIAAGAGFCSAEDINKGDNETAIWKSTSSYTSARQNYYNQNLSDSESDGEGESANVSEKDEDEEEDEDGDETTKMLRQVSIVLSYY